MSESTIGETNVSIVGSPIFGFVNASVSGCSNFKTPARAFRAADMAKYFEIEPTVLTVISTHAIQGSPFEDQFDRTEYLSTTIPLANIGNAVGAVIQLKTLPLESRWEPILETHDPAFALWQFERSTVERALRQTSAALRSFGALEIAKSFSIASWQASVLRATVRDAGAVVIARLDRLRRFYDELDVLAAQNYGIDRPTLTAVSLARQVLDIVRVSRLTPQRLVDYAGGVLLYFSAGEGYAEIVCENDGSLVVILNAPSTPPRIWTGTSDEAVEAIAQVRAHLV